MPRLTRARASAFGLFLAIAAALLGFAAGAALAKDPSGRADGEDERCRRARLRPAKREAKARPRISSLSRTPLSCTSPAATPPRVDLAGGLPSHRDDAARDGFGAFGSRRSSFGARRAGCAPPPCRAREAIDEATDQRSRSQDDLASGARGVRRAAGRGKLRARKQTARGAKVSGGPRSLRRGGGADSRARPGQSHAGVVAVLPRDFRGAVGSFKTVLARQPTWEGLSNGLGWSRLRIGRYQLAADAFRESARPKSRLRRRLNGLGSALFERGDYEAALPPLERALDGYRRLTARSLQR